MRILLITPAIFLLSFFLAQADFRLPSDTTCNRCPESIQQPLSQALDIMQKKYYNRENVDWEYLKKTALEKIQQPGEDTRSVLTWCFGQVNERHSFIMPPAETQSYSGEANSSLAPVQLSDFIGPIRAEIVNGNIAYLSVPWVKTTDSVICSLVADSLQTLIESLDTKSISGWVVDLRSNSGGNCWPMLAGIGPLLGNGTHGYFLCENRRLPIHYENGLAMNGKHCICRVGRKPYVPSGSAKQIAVLIGAGTSSAGEIVALAFKGAEQVKLFGQPTAGYTTGNTTYKLGDGSMLVLAVATEADRFGNMCSGRIKPDVEIPADATKNDEVMDAAVEWLLGQGTKIKIQ